MDTRQLAFDFMAAMGDPNGAVLEAMCAIDMRSEWLDLMSFESRDAFLKVHKSDHDRHSGFRSEIVKILVSDETSVCFRGRVSAEQGRLVPPTPDRMPVGRPFSINLLCWLDTADGLITNVVLGVNAMALLTQLGHFETKP